MIEKTVVRRLFLFSQAPLRSTVSGTAARYGRPQPLQRYYSSLPSVTQVSFWESMIPKPLRRSNKLKSKKPKSTEWNPATFFIAILLLIGSMSIQMIALRNEFATFIRRADAKIDLLREVIEKVQNGEEVDVEGLLGAGNAEKEQEWEERPQAPPVKLQGQSKHLMHRVDSIEKYPGETSSSSIYQYLLNTIKSKAYTQGTAFPSPQHGQLKSDIQGFYPR
ncbi:hypothetical protein V496_06996 [Pseudogymnoascus sp. VKM F-4515 (FW-2607)]|nr:hypothetical protein V496_06996 [Pseudogymnoascus sp. VKM F-4515 (FW-2607)]